jgi:hypothetical protein
LFQPATMLMPKRPGAIESIVTAIRATIAGCSVGVATDAYSSISSVTAASPAIRVNDSSA